MLYKKIRKTLKEIKEILINEFDLIDKMTIQRVRKIQTRDIFFTLIKMIQNHTSYSQTNCQLKLDEYITVSYQAVHQKIILQQLKLL